MRNRLKDSTSLAFGKQHGTSKYALERVRRIEPLECEHLHVTSKLRCSVIYDLASSVLIMNGT